MCERMFVYNPTVAHHSKQSVRPTHSYGFRHSAEIAVDLRMGNNSKDRNADSSGAEEEEEEEYVVEKILNRRVKHGKVT